MNRKSAFTLLLCTLLMPISSLSSFGIEIEIVYEWDSGDISIKNFAITPPQLDNDDSFSDVALYEAAIITKATAKQIMLVSNKDPEKIALLNKQLNALIDTNNVIDLKINKEKDKKRQLALAIHEEKTVAKNKLSQFLQKNNKEI